MVVAIAELSGLSMSHKIKELLLRAWRERWSEIDFGRNIKRLLPRGVSGDVYDLADYILRQAIKGPVPNTLLISYLNHCLSSQIVSFGAVILAITKIPEPKPNCVYSLLEFVNKYKSRVSCYGNEAECLALSRSLVALLNWLYQIISTSIVSSVSSLSTTSDDVNLKIIKLTSEILTHLTQSSFLKALLYVGKLEEPLLWGQFFKQYKEVTPKLAMINDRSFEMTSQAIVNFPNNIEWLSASMNLEKDFPLASSPVISVAIKQITNQSTYIPYRPIAFRCLQAAISFSAVLDRFNTAEMLANQIAMIRRYFNIDRSQIYCESMHVTFVSLIEAQKLCLDKMEKNYFHKWVAFFFFKLPHVFLGLSQPSRPETGALADFEAGLDLLMERVPLLDLFTSLLPGEYLPKFIDECVKISLLSPKKAEQFLQSRKMCKWSATASSDANFGQSVLVIRAEKTLHAVIDSLKPDNIITSSNPEDILGVMCRMNTNLEVLICTSAFNGNLMKLAQKLVYQNETSKVSTGENLRTSQTRALFFDISFLLMCCLVQHFGSEVLLKHPDLKDSFFAKWSLVNFTEDLSPDAILCAASESSKLDSQLSHFIVSSSTVEFKTCLVRWNDMCMAVQLAVSEILSAWTHNVISEDAVKLFLERLKSKLCFPAVVAACLLIAQLKKASHEESVKILSMLNELRTPFKEDLAENVDSPADALVTFHKERSMLLQVIIKKLFKRHLPHAISPGLELRTTFLRLSRSSLNEQLKVTLDATKGHFSMENINDFDGLMALGGPRWFTNNIVAILFEQNEIARLQQAVDLAYGLFHLDLEQCALVLLRETIPRVLLYKSQQENLSEPRVTALVRLAIMTTFGAISHLQSLAKSGFSHQSVQRRQYQNNSHEWQLGSFNEQMLENTAYIYESQLLPGSKGSNDLENSRTAMEVDDEEKPSASPDGSGLLKEPLFIEFIRFLNLLLEISLDSDFSPRSMVSVAVLEQILLCLREDAHQFLQFVPLPLLDGIIRFTYDILSFEQLLAYLCLDSVRARKAGARLLCQLQLSKVHGI